MNKPDSLIAHKHCYICVAIIVAESFNTAGKKNLPGQVLVEEGHQVASREHEVGMACVRMTDDRVLIQTLL